MSIEIQTKFFSIIFVFCCLLTLGCQEKVSSNISYLNRQYYISNNVENHLSSWSPDGTKIAFMVGGNHFEYHYAYIMNTDGTNKKQIGAIDRYDDISWSNDSKKIILTIPAKYKRGFQIYDVNTGNLFFEQVLSDGIGHYLPLEKIQWIKDKLVWVIYGMSFMVSTTNSDENALRLNIPTNSIEGKNPVLSPDGKKILFTNTKLNFTTILDLETKEEKRIDYIFDSPLWNKDSNKILFISDDKDKKNQIEIFDLLKNESKKIYLYDGAIFSIFWSYDEKSISFISGEHNEKYKRYKNNIYKLDLESFILTKISQDKYEINDPLWYSEGDECYKFLWSPNGDKIAFTKQKYYLLQNIWVMNSDGSNQKQLTNNTYSLYAYKNYAYIDQ
jgi:Tol biopolymer transport system component